MPRFRVILLVSLLAGCSPLRGCVESQFTLETGSRLPLWFAEARRDSPSEASVELTYWTNGDAVFELKSRSGETIKKVSGASCWHPETRYTRNPDGTVTPPKGPEYVIMKAAGIVDVVEHRDQPGVFRMSDNESINREAKESVTRGECRHEP